MPLAQVLITGERAKLPAEYQPLFDEQQPLPPDVQFFEERKTAGSLLWRLLVGIGLLVIGILGACLGVFVLFYPDTAGTTTVTSTVSITPLLISLVFILGGGLLLGSLRQTQRLRREQQAGKATRQGIYLTPDVLISHDEFAYTLIPRSEFRGYRELRCIIFGTTRPSRFVCQAKWSTPRPRPCCPPLPNGPPMRHCNRSNN